jgi:hypothetical protein
VSTPAGHTPSRFWYQELCIKISTIQELLKYFNLARKLKMMAGQIAALRNILTPHMDDGEG